MKSNKYSKTEIDDIIVRLTYEFEIACQTYRLALSSRNSNRAKKELSKGNTRGTTTHKYQCEFSWILHDIATGPTAFIDDRIQDARDIISHLSNISNV